MLTLVFLALMGQIRPDTVMDDRLHDAAFYRRVQEAKIQADQWAFQEMRHLYVASQAARWERRSGGMSMRSREITLDILKRGAYKQICDAYDITEDEFKSIMKNDAVRKLRVMPERIAGNGPKMGVNPWDLRPTRFDSSKVAIPEKQAKAIGYTNPHPYRITQGKPKVFSDEAIKNGAGK